MLAVALSVNAGDSMLAVPLSVTDGDGALNL